MQVKLTNIVDKYALTTKDFIPSEGLSYLIEFDEKKILFDAGDKGFILQNNMKLLDIDPETIDKLVLSHGHYDHTFGIESLLKARKNAPPLEIIAHPLSFKQRRIGNLLVRTLAYLKYKMRNFGFPELPEELQSRYIQKPVTEPTDLAPFLKTIGEISEWPEKDSKNKRLKIRIDKKFVEDDILDDLSLVLKTKEGIVLILGCGHAGVLNICARAKELYPQEDIKRIIGGTHLVALTEEEDLEYVAKKLEEVYKKPSLYFSHCTGPKATNFLKNYFGKEIVKSFKVGETMTFEC
jgi:7,8-dihydropterin-6-yl-methyl-4-(beta-D-ribofuranosyl)aminobenzene 5'-phosphate synthase